MFRQRLSRGMAKRLASRVGKEYLLDQFRIQWALNLPPDRNIDVDAVVDGSMQRIRESGMAEIFDKVGITRKDLVKALGEVIRGSYKWN